MGCTESTVIDASSDPNLNEKSKLQRTSQSKTAADKEKTDSYYTVKQFFDTALTLPVLDGQPYSQPQLPNHYVQQNINFENENVATEIWDRKIKVDEKPQKTKDKTNKGKEDTEISWHYRKLPNRKYSEPENTTTINIEYEQGSKKKQVLVVGGLYLGGNAASLDNVFEHVDVEATHSLVILGNLFDTLSTDGFHQMPSDITQIESVLAQSESVLASIRQLTESINVYYMRGSYDFDLTRVAIERLLGDKVNYIQQKNLILALKVEKETYRLLVTTGQQWDFMNSRGELSAEQLLVGRPIGHYVARASSTNPNFSLSALIKPIISSIPSDLSKQFLQQISKRPLQDKLTEKMLLAAFQLSKPEELIDIKCLVDEGKYISAQTIVEYPYIKYLLEKVGEQKLMCMLKAMIGDYSGVTKGYGEDVLIAGLGDEATLSKLSTESGQDIVCASTGSCSRRSDKVTMLRVSYPRPGSNGKVEIITPTAQKSPQKTAAAEQKAEVVQDKSEDSISVESL